MASFTLNQLAEHISGELRGDPECVIEGIAPLAKACSGQISFLSDGKHRRELESTSASAVIIRAEDAEGLHGNLIVVPNPYLAYARIAALFDTSVGLGRRGGRCPSHGIHRALCRH